MKRIDVGFLSMVIFVSVLLFILLQGKISNNYLVLLIFGFGLVVGLVKRFILKYEKTPN
jgi:ribose/xylose/arabinose/galactoside ABC-type transport system permease subunit